MYRLTTPLISVHGIGPRFSEHFGAAGFQTVKDLLLSVPRRYIDRSQIVTIEEFLADETPNKIVTLIAEVVTARGSYFRGKSFQTATIKDDTGKLKVKWFNNPHVVDRLKTGQKFLFSGKLYKGALSQPVVEMLRDDPRHTGRLVPVYPTIPEIAEATLRTIYKEILDHLQPVPDPLEKLVLESTKKSGSANDLVDHTNLVCSLNTALHELHFPSDDEHIIIGRERLALEELILLIQHSQKLKESWQHERAGFQLPPIDEKSFSNDLPFELTNAQQRCISEILSDLQQPVPMNRLLVGDVGSGKTAVAGRACQAILASAHHVAFVAPTQMLANQHIETFQKLFPKLRVQLLTAQQKLKADEFTKILQTPTVFIGTHAVLSHLQQIKPALLIYDEQHRFGVAQRSHAYDLDPRPHVLTLSATPIPRTLMLTLFAHLSLSVIGELPPGRKPIQSVVVKETQRAKVWERLAASIQKNQSQALVVCPFVDPSETPGFTEIAAATTTFRTLKKIYKDTQLRIGLLHGRQPKPEQAKVTEALYAKKLDVVVTTPIVEVGVDLPAASIIVIEAAERFGLASLHQMRGRVGRAGQAAYCVLFTNAKAPEAVKRLERFCQTHNGTALAEQDLERRGAGDLFGTRQHGDDQLHFADWGNLVLIARAQHLVEHLPPNWQSFLPRSMVIHDQDVVPLAN